METLRVLVAFGTRPEAIKMAPIVQAMKHDAAFDVQVLSTAQHQEMLDQVVSLFHLSIDYDLDAMRNRQTLADLTARLLSTVPSVLAQAQPDIVLVHGDTATAFTVALAGFYAQIPVGHIEAGLRSYERYSPFPEEMNRKLISDLATFHFAPTSSNLANLLAEGVAANDIWVTGNTVIDALLSVVSPLHRFTSPELAALDFKCKRIVGLTCHRRENLGKPMEHIFAAIRDVVDNRDNVEVVYPVHKNPVVYEIANQVLGGHPRIHLVEPLDYCDFSNFIARCTLMLSDSGGVQEEAPALNVPVLVLRDTTERPEALEAGCVALAGTSYEDVYAAFSSLLDNDDAYYKMASAPDPYGDGHASSRICAALRLVFDLG